MTKRILIVMGSPEDETSRLVSHMSTLEMLQCLSEKFKLEVVFLYLLPTGNYAFPEELSDDGSLIAEEFSWNEMADLLKSIQFDGAIPMVTCSYGLNVFHQILRTLSVQRVTGLDQLENVLQARAHRKTSSVSRTTLWKQLSQFSVN